MRGERNNGGIIFLERRAQPCKLGFDFGSALTEPADRRRVDLAASGHGVRKFGFRCDPYLARPRKRFADFRDIRRNERLGLRFARGVGLRGNGHDAFGRRIVDQRAFRRFQILSQRSQACFQIFACVGGCRETAIGIGLDELRYPKIGEFDRKLRRRRGKADVDKAGGFAPGRPSGDRERARSTIGQILPFAPRHVVFSAVELESAHEILVRQKIAGTHDPFGQRARFSSEYCVL